MNIENFFTNHINTIQAIVALGTWAAVVISLWTARKEKPKLSCKASIMIAITIGNLKNPQIHQEEKILNINIINKNDLTVYIPEFFLAWKMPFPLNKIFNVEFLQRVQDRYNKGTMLVEPRRSYDLNVTDKPVELIQDLKSQLLKTKYPECLHRFLYLSVITSNGSTFKVTMSKDIINILK